MRTSSRATHITNVNQSKTHAESSIGDLMEPSGRVHEVGTTPSQCPSVTEGATTVRQRVAVSGRRWLGGPDARRTNATTSVDGALGRQLQGLHARDSRGTESDLLRVLTHSACSHHPSAAASPRRSVALGAERMLVPSEGEGASILSAPNALRHFSIQKKRGSTPPNLTSARLPITVFERRGPMRGDQSLPVCSCAACACWRSLALARGSRRARSFWGP